MNWLLCIVFLTVWLVPRPASALELVLEGGVGATFFRNRAPDGTWVQEDFGYKVHGRDVAFRAGVGLKVNEHWTVGLNYLDLGTIMVESRYVADSSYDPTHHKCMKDCDKAQHLRTFDALYGGELIATYRPWDWPVAPYLRGGVALLRHQLNWQNTTLSGYESWHQWNGIIVAAAGGVGVCYHGWACADVTYYKGLGTTGFPIARDAVVPMVVLRYAF